MEKISLVMKRKDIVIVKNRECVIVIWSDANVLWPNHLY